MNGSPTGSERLDLHAARRVEHLGGLPIGIPGPADVDRRDRREVEGELVAPAAAPRVDHPGQDDLDDLLEPPRV